MAQNLDLLNRGDMIVIDMFRHNLFGQYTIHDLMKRLSKKSYIRIFEAVKKLNKMGIIKIEPKGRAKICSINLDETKAMAYLSLLDELDSQSRKYIPMDNVKELLDSLPLSFFTFIITGSYAAGKQTKNSDLDIVVLAEDGIDKKRILAILISKGRTMIPEIHPYVFTRSEFLQMLADKETNYGKLFFHKRLIVSGAENYYMMVKEAIRNGFRG